MRIFIYTDGACDAHAPNQPGGWAAILCATDASGAVVKESVLSGGAEMTTNNQMELTAAIKALQALKRPAQATIVSDSKYVIDIACKRKKSRKNADLWQRYFEVAAQHRVTWHYVAGHTGHEYNERCDRLAVAEKNRLARPKTHASGQPRQKIESDITVYLATTYCPRRKTAAWSAVTLSGGQVAQQGAALAKTSELEAALIAAKTSLAALPAHQSVTLLTAQQNLAQGMNNWSEKWQAKGWKTKDGKPVKHQSHWRALLALAQAREAAFVFVKARDQDAHFKRASDLSKQLLERAN